LIQATGLVLQGDFTVAGQCRIFTGLRCIAAPYMRNDIQSPVKFSCLY